MTPFSGEGLWIPQDSYPLDDKRHITFVAAARRDSKMLKAWDEAARGESNPIRRDAADLAHLAFRRWREARAGLYVASTLREIQASTQNNPYAEVAVLILAKGEFLRNGRLAGLCFFRRTWCNNILIDFLAVHPLLAQNPDAPVRGVGFALLYFVAHVAESLRARAIWGEATQNSAKFYAGIFKKRVRDLFYVTQLKYVAFRSELEAKLRERSKHR
ncbi:MAG: hypothetical protein HY047_03705 [Acidobacteria bacterium]|nr:hypothetical protein [Acidobacteriota bacterium]